MSIKREVDKENVIHKFKVNVFIHKKSEIITFGGKMDAAGK